MNDSHDPGTAPRRSQARRIGRWVSALILTLVLLVGAALIAVFSFEQSTLRPLAEHLVEQITGRALSIEGELDARAGRIVSVRAGGISLANANWGSSEKMLRIGEAEISIDLWQLFDGALAIDNVAISHGELLLEADDQGRSNWAMGSGDAQSQTASEGPGALALLVFGAELSDIDIKVINPAMIRPLDIHLDSVVQSAEQGNELHATVAGTVDDRAFDVRVRISPLTELLAAGEVDFDIDADFAAVTLDASGHLDSLLSPRQATLHISLVSAQTSHIVTLFGLPEVFNGAAELKASMLPSDDHHRLDVSASIGTFNLDAHARLQALDTIDGASIELSAGGPDLAAAAKLAGVNGLPSQPFKIGSQLDLSGKRLQIGETYFNVGDTQLTAKGAMNRFPELEGTDLNLQLVGKNYLEFSELLGLAQVAKLEPKPFEVNAELEYVARDQQKFTARVTLADINGEFGGRLTEYPAFVDSHLDYRIDGLKGALIERLLGRRTQIDGPYTLQGAVRRTRTGFSIERTSLSFGANQLHISGLIGNDPLRKDSDLSARYHGPDLDKIAAIAGYSGFVPAGTSEITLAARAQADGIHLDSLSARIASSRLKASGLISLQADLAGSRVNLALAGEDIGHVLPPDLLSYVDPQQSFELAGTLATSSGRLAIDALKARLGETRLEATGSVSRSQPMTDTSLTVTAHGPDLAAIIPEQMVPYPLPADEFSVSGGVALDKNGLALDDVKAAIGADRLGVSGSIPLDTPLDGLNLVIAASGTNLAGLVPFEIEQIDLNKLAYKIDGNIQLAGGILSLRKLDFSTPRGRVAGDLSISLADPHKFGQFDLEAHGDKLDEFVVALPDYQPAAVPFDLNARGSWDDKKVSVENGVLKLDNATIKVQGVVDLPPNQTETRLLLSAHGDSLADLGEVKGLVLPPEKFHIEASLLGDANKLAIPEFDVGIGESDLRGSIKIEFAEKPDIKIILKSELFDLAKLLPSEDSQAEVEAPPKPLAGDGRVIPQLPVPVDQLNRVNMVTDIILGELRLPGQTLRNIEIDLSLQDGDLIVSQLKSTATEGILTAQFRLTADGDRVVTSGTLEGNEIVFSSEEVVEDVGRSSPQQDLYLTFQTEGATSRELAANLNGFAQLTGGTGRLKNNFLLGLFGSFFEELLSAINPFVTKEPYTNISCFGAYAEIVDGLVSTNPGAVLRTDKLDMFASGQIDLKSEQVKLRFDTSARSGIGVSLADFVNPFVGVGGTLARPRLGVDPKNAMFEGGVAYATGGLSIVGKSLFNRWFGAKDPCVQLANQAEEYLNAKKVNQQREQDAAEKE
ncbi:AsmA family protein [Gammaproteobacteria bacterium]|nr:AsmA family protein [Gammaproteobacteria bacterium]